jgi:hypothetical protein
MNIRCAGFSKGHFERGFEVVTACDLGEASEKQDAGRSGTQLLEKAEAIARKPKMVPCSAFVTDELEEAFGRGGNDIFEKALQTAGIGRCTCSLWGLNR